MSESGLSIIIKNAIKAGRLKSAGALTLDGQVIFQPEAQAGNADEFGFLPPETDFGGSQNEKVNELRKEWSQSSDKLKQEAVKQTPHLFVAITDAYNPDRDSEAFYLYVHNNNWFWMAGAGHMRPYVDFNYKPIDGHLFMSMGNSYDPSSDGYARLMNGFVDAYRKVLETTYDNLKYGGLNQRP